MKNRQKLGLAALGAGSFALGAIDYDYTQKTEKKIVTQGKTIDSLQNVLTQQQGEMANHTSMDWEVVQFLSAHKETGIPRAMVDLLANDERWALEIHEGSNLPAFVHGKVHSYANQQHALLVLRGTGTDDKNNPEDIKTFIDFTRGEGGPFPAEVIVWSAYKQRLQTPQIFTLTDNHKLLSAGGKIVDLKDVINTGYVEYSADYIE